MPEVMTLYSWDWAWSETVFTERLAGRMYDTFPPGLREALGALEPLSRYLRLTQFTLFTDFIVSHDMPLYIMNDHELRRHQYFGCGSPTDLTGAQDDFERNHLLPPSTFAKLLREVSYQDQAAVGKTTLKTTMDYQY